MFIQLKKRHELLSQLGNVHAKIPLDALIKVSEISIVKRLSSSSKGRVYLGIFRGSRVTVTVLPSIKSNGKCNSMMQSKIDAEAKQLCDIRHPNIGFFLFLIFFCFFCFFSTV